MPVTLRQNAFQSGFAALLMLFVGWGMSAKGISTNAFYNTTVDVFYWSLRIGGIALAIAVGLCAANLRIGLLVDAIVSGLCGAIVTLIAIYWLIDAGGIDLQYLIYLVFGGGFVSEATISFRNYRALQDAGDQVAIAQPVPVVESVHPASIRPSSLPKDNDPPPPDGYLAALAKEKDEPPTASFE